MALTSFYGRTRACRRVLGHQSRDSSGEKGIVCTVSLPRDSESCVVYLSGKMDAVNIYGNIVMLGFKWLYMNW